MKKSLITAALLCAAPMFSKTIKEIKYEGLIHISPIVANEIVGLQEGSELDPMAIDEALRKFYKQGYFKDIYVIEENGVLTFHFKEKPIIASIEIRGYGSTKEQGELEKEVGLKKGDVYDKDKIAKAKRAIIEAVEAKGYFDTVVEATTEEINEYSLKLILDVNKGEQITIDEIEYCGVDEYDGSDFEPYIANKERDFLGWMWGFNDGYLRVNDLEVDGRRIREYYMRKGFLDAEVSPAHLQANFTDYKATLSYKINEGRKYFIESVEVVQNEEVEDKQKLMELLNVEPGDRFNIERVRKDATRIKDAIGDLGYAFATVEPKMDKNEENSTLKITYVVDPGKKVYINDVFISGNIRTLDRVIRRDVLLAPGDLYNMTDMKDSKLKLRRSGYFDEVEIDEIRVSEDKIDLHVNVEEAKTGEFKFGLGYGSYGGLSGSIGVSDKNVFGSGLGASAAIDASSKSTTFSFSLYNPRVLDSEYSLKSTLYQTKNEAADYTEYATGFSVTGGKFLTRHLQATLGYAATYTLLKDVNVTTASYGDESFFKSAIIPGISYDTTNDYYFPTEGIDASASMEIAGIGGDEKYIKTFGVLEAFYGLEDDYDRDIILRSRSKVGFIVDTGYLPINQKMYLGGVKTLRGFESNTLSPIDVNGTRIGGDQMFSQSLEASFGLFETVQMRLNLFADFGMIGDGSIGDISRYSTGYAIEWLSPMGPLNLIFPMYSNSKPTDRTSSFEFVMGQRF